LRIADFGLRIGGQTCGGTPPAACHVQSTADKMCKTNPTCPAVPGGPAPPLDPAASPLGQRRSCKTKPISESRPAGGRLCKTKPNLGRMGHLGDGAPGRSIVRNKPNFRRAGPLGPVDRAKQSQFPGSARGGLQGTSRITPHGVTTNAGPIVRNKANSTGSIGRASIVQWQNKANPPRPRVGRGLGDETRLCKTNPIWDARRRRGVSLRTNKANWVPWPVVRNKANCRPGRIPHHSTIPSFQHSIPAARVQTKPILLSWARYQTPPGGSTKCRHRRQP
jgi:hypothetical protein